MALSTRQLVKQALIDAGLTADEAEVRITAAAAKNALLQTDAQLYDSNELNSMKGRAEQAQARATQLEKWYTESAKPEYEAMKAEYDRILSVVNKGALPGNGGVNAGNGGGNDNDDDRPLTRKEVEAMVSRTSAVLNSGVKGVTKLVAKYRDEYGKNLDLDAFEEFSEKGGYRNIDAAYRDFTAEDREKKRAEEVEKTVKARVDEELKKIGSSRDLPGRRRVENVFEKAARSTDVNRQAPDNHLADLADFWEQGSAEVTANLGM